jgi:hypothetical protein
MTRREKQLRKEIQTFQSQLDIFEPETKRLRNLLRLKRNDLSQLLEIPRGVGLF